MNNGFEARLARLEARRREDVPDLRRLAEAEARLIAWADGLHGLDELRAGRALIEAALRRIER